MRKRELRLTASNAFVTPMKNEWRLNYMQDTFLLWSGCKYHVCRTSCTFESALGLRDTVFYQGWCDAPLTRFARNFPATDCQSS